MIKKKILVPVDFSEVSTCAINVAKSIAQVNGNDLALLHIADNKSATNAESEMQSFVKNIVKDNNLTIEIIIRKGNIFSEITDVATDGAFGLMVIGTHGFKGLREKVFGADILKLLKSIPIPVLALQKGYELPSLGIKKILFPASSHETFATNIESAVNFAKLFNAEIFLYTIEKPGIEWSDKFKENIRLAKHEFEANSIQYTRIKEDQQSFSVGYSKQIMAYAKNNGIDLITLISNASDENYSFADSDKASLIINNAKIPVLCTSDKQIV